MAKYQRYAEYKDSGLDWLGQIPNHWEVKKLKYLGEAIIGLTYSPDDVVDEGEGTLVLRSSNIQNKKLTFDDNVFVRKAIPENLRTQRNDILICARNGSRALIGKNAMIDESAEGLSFGAFMSIFRSKYNRYLSKVFNSALFEYQSGTFLTATINQLTTGNLNSFEVPLPPEDERAKIANFLDHETAKIDSLIEKQQKLIELLKEKRQAVISHAVTKGLDPNVQMKDSGVEWLGKVPEHWTVTRFAYEIFFQEGPGILAIDFQENGIPLLRIQNVKSDFVSNDYKTYLSPSKVLSKWDHYRVEKGDLIISCSASTGLVSEVDEATVGAIPYTGLIRLKPRTPKIISPYIKLLVQSDLFFEQIEVLQTGSTIQHFGPFHLQQMYISLPPNEEQEEICSEVAKRVQDIEKLTFKAELAIQLMQERRTALISAAVTGKIDVRNWQASNATEQEMEVST